MGKPRGMRTQKDTDEYTHTITIQERILALCALAMSAFVGHGVASVTGFGNHIWLVIASMIVTSIFLKDYFI